MNKLKWKKTVLFAIALFLMWNIIWLVMVTVKYNHFIERIPKNEFGLHHKKDEEGYSYSVKTPNYLRLVGNLAVSNENTNEVLIIWPKLYGGYDYGIRIQKEGQVFEFYIDDKKNPVNKDENNEFVKQQIKLHEREIDELLKRAKNAFEM